MGVLKEFRRYREYRRQARTGRAGTPVGKVQSTIRHDDWAWVQSPEFTNDLVAYVYREWISTAIDRVAELCVSVPLEVRNRDGSLVVDHPLLDLLGRHGRPNALQDSMEFLEAHFQRVDVFGNDVWYWFSNEGGAPDEVYQLELSRLRIRVDDRGDVIYEYRTGAGIRQLDGSAITHFKRSNILGSGMFWGLSAIQKLRNVVLSDSEMTRWNQEFFHTGAPSGVLILNEASVSPAEAKRIENEMHLSASEKRRMIVIRAPEGAAVWHDANLAHRDLSFNDGRLMTRQAAFDALGFHVGAVSEASTEAHARVAERLVRNSAHARHLRMSSKLNSVLAFWPDASRYRIQWQDVRVVDWEMEARKLQAVMPYLTVNEVRSRYLDASAIIGGDVMAEKGKALDGGESEGENGSERSRDGEG